MLNSPSPGVIAPLAKTQLAKWQDLAANHWPWSNDEGVHMCGDCGARIHQVHDSQGNPYLITSDELFALEVAHLRVRHGSVDPNAKD